MATTATRGAVLFLTPQPFFEPRGSSIKVRFAVQALAELGFEVDLLAFPWGDDIEIPGVRIIRCDNTFARRGMPVGPSFWKAVYDLLLGVRAWQVTGRKCYQVIHGVEEAGIIGLLLRRIRGARLVAEKHSDAASYRRGALRNLVLALYQQLDRYALRRADAVVTGPPLLPLARTLAGHARIYSVCSVPSTSREADEHRTRAIRRRLQRRESDLLVTYVGTFAGYQGVELMFEAIPAVLAEQSEVRFVIIGGTAGAIDRWRRWLKPRHVADDVVLLERIEPDDVPDYLAASDILLSPRLTGRNPPLKHLDYLKAGRPIVATDTPPNRFYLNDEVALMTDATAGAFSAGIVRLVRERALRQRLGQGGRRLIEGKYDYLQLKRGLEACYDELARRKVPERHAVVGLFRTN